MFNKWFTITATFCIKWSRNC